MRSWSIISRIRVVLLEFVRLSEKGKSRAEGRERGVPQVSARLEPRA